MDIDITKPAEDTYSIKISDAYLVEIDSERKLLTEQSSKTVYSSSDEEEESIFKIREIETTRSRRPGLPYQKDKKLRTGTRRIDLLQLEMPVVAKRGCLNSSWYICHIAKLKDLQDRGDFEEHEQLLQKLLASKRSAEHTDLQASLQIERAVALYMQNNVKDAKKIAKGVLDLEKQMRNPEVLIARALNLLTSIYKTQTKFGNAWICVQKATTALMHHDSPVDRAELYQSYGGLISYLLTVGRCGLKLKEEAYNSYEIALDCANDPVDKEYITVKMAKLLLGKFVSEDDVVQAKKHLDSIEFRAKAEAKAGVKSGAKAGAKDDDMAVGTKINLVLLRSDQFRFEGNVAMALERAEEAQALIKNYKGFERQLASAEKQIHRLSEALSPESGSLKGVVGDKSSSD